MQTLARIVATLALLALAGFCIFGFMASYEYSDSARRLPWQIGYGTLGAAGLFFVIFLWRPRRGGAPRPSSPNKNGPRA